MQLTFLTQPPALSPVPPALPGPRALCGPREQVTHIAEDPGQVERIWLLWSV